MKKKIIILASIILISILGLVLIFNVNEERAAFTSLIESQGVQEVTVYKSPTCGCCDIYVSYLEQFGFEVDVKNQEDLEPVKTAYGIPEDLYSCHTTIVGDYFVEGHVPIEAVEKLITEQPDINGIALPDMPSGTPGMPGPKLEDYIIRAVTDQDTSLFMQL